MKDNNLEIIAPQSVSVEMDYEGSGKTSETPNEETTVEDSQDQSNSENDYSQDNEDNEDSSEPQKKPRSKRWEKQRRDREEKFLLAQALAEEKRLNLELKNYLSRSVDNNTMSAAEKAYRDMQEAEYAHAQALESNNALAASKASSALIQANLALERIANIKRYSSDKDEPININPTAYAADRILNDWLIDNPEFDEESKNFDKELVSKVAPLIDKLDSKLKKRGQAHLISSPKYFDIIDSVVSQIKSNKKYSGPKTTPVSSRRYEGYEQPQRQRGLTEQQKMVAAGCNMSEAEYITWLNKYEREKLAREGNNNYGY